jgi:uncharacterized protein (TIGR03083 family)
MSFPSTAQRLKTERLRLADYLTSLTPPQWETQSLCAEWLVRDVVAHIILGFSYTLPMMGKGILRARGNMYQFMGREAQRLGALDPPQLVQKLRAGAGSTKTPIGITQEEALIDLYIHTMDIMLPLGVPAPLNPDQLAFIVDFVANHPHAVGLRIMNFPRRAKGLHFQAIDTGWHYGSGLLVTGPAQDIILALTGRKLGLQHLSGDGLSTLSQRI